MRLCISILVAGAAATGCVADGHVGYRATVVVPPPPVVTVGVGVNANAGYDAPPPQEEVVVQPDLVEVSPGVQVIADYDEPVFWSNSFYWRYDGGVWYSSRDYRGGGWRVESNVPMGIRGIDRPNYYAHYRPAGYVARNRPQPYRRGIEPVRGNGGGRIEPVRGGVEPVRGPEPVRGGAEVHGNIEPVRGVEPVRGPEPVRGGADVHGNIEPVRGGAEVHGGADVHGGGAVEPVHGQPARTEPVHGATNTQPVKQAPKPVAHPPPPPKKKTN